MTPELFQYYQELIDAIAPICSDDWEMFRLEGEVDESGLGLSLQFRLAGGVEKEFSVPFEVFDIMEKIRATTGQTSDWSEWIFGCNHSGQYNISVKYPETQST